ncbi:MAG TPA: L-seryl-tRNA(Sec) selenium transferase [Candidatus Limnocylindria bacterium]|nr:L-seryl-tRNA(Sec) selenium transferase [Candidatus Limnocylindria bacterium]
MSRMAPAARPPSVERLLAAARSLLDEPEREHGALVAAARELVAEERVLLSGGAEPRQLAALATELVGRLSEITRPGLTRAINATGVILHTNLGRAPWPDAAIEAARRAAGGYLTLELDRATGRRGARFREAEEHVVALTGADDALVVNNNAAAAALAVGLAGRGGGIAVSRGELVEIGGGVRIPDILRRAGARLVEVGTTNRTRVADFAEQLAGGHVRAILRVHPSNFRQVGFTERPDGRSLADLAHAHGAFVIDDLGSGALLDTAAYGLAHEPTPGESLAGGSDLVTFSGDKLLGGPQAGLIAGRGDLVARLRRDPLARAMRPDKVTLAALAATLGLYRAGRALAEIPVWRMIARPAEELRRRALRLLAEPGLAALGAAGGQVVETRATVGGGSLPGETLPSYGLSIRSPDISADRLMARLRSGDPPVIGRVVDGAVLLDLRTVDPADDGLLGAAVLAASRPIASRPIAIRPAAIRPAAGPPAE